MSPDLDEDIVEQVDALGVTSWSGTVYRYTSASRDALSGEGARLNGGRWNPRGLFPTVYLADPFPACLSEFKRMAHAFGMPPQAIIARGYLTHTIAVTTLPVLDLRTDGALDRVGLQRSDIEDQDDWTACQAVGHAAWFLERAGILAPSATGEGTVLAAFEERVGPGQLALRASRTLLATDLSSPGAPPA